MILALLADRVVTVGVIFAGAIVGISEAIEIVISVNNRAGQWCSQAAIDRLADAFSRAEVGGSINRKTKWLGKANKPSQLLYDL